MFHCPARFSEMYGNCCNYNVEFASKKAGYTPMIDMLYLNLQGSWQCLFRFRSPSNLFCKCNFLGKTNFLIHFTGHLRRVFQAPGHTWRTRIGCSTLPCITAGVEDLAGKSSCGSGGHPGWSRGRKMSAIKAIWSSERLWSIAIPF